jgi:hypothetical protein
MVHGVLHYADTRTREKKKLLMRSKENEKLALFHVNNKN